MTHTIEIINDYDPISSVVWVLVDGSRRFCLHAASADGVNAAIADLLEQLDAEDNQPQAVKKYSKLKLYAALAEMGLWDTLRAWMEARTLDNGVNVYTAFSLAQELTSDHPLFADYLAEAQSALGVDAETVAQVLAACETEG